MVDVYDKFTDCEKELMVEAWNRQFGSNLSLATLPFVNKQMMLRALFMYDNLGFNNQQTVADWELTIKKLVN